VIEHFKGYGRNRLMRECQVPASGRGRPSPSKSGAKKPPAAAVTTNPQSQTETRIPPTLNCGPEENSTQRGQQCFTGGAASHRPSLLPNTKVEADRRSSMPAAPRYTQPPSTQQQDSRILSRASHKTKRAH